MFWYSLQVVFGDINPRAGEATEIEFGEKYGRDRVRFIHFDVTDGPKFEGTSTVYLIVTLNPFI